MHRMMASHLALPRCGHLEALFHMFAYLKAHHNAEMVFDPSEPELDMSAFPREDWGLSIYGDTPEELPPQKPFEESGPADMPEPRGKPFRIVVYIDCNLEGISCYKEIKNRLCCLSQQRSSLLDE